MSSSSVFTVGAKYGLGTIKSGSYVTDNNSIALSGKNQLSLEFSPGTLISDKTLAYGLVSYEKIKLVGDTPTIQISANAHGSGFGAGTRTMIDNKTYFQIEIKQINYGTAAATTPGGSVNLATKAAVGTIGIGMKF